MFLFAVFPIAEEQARRYSRVAALRRSLTGSMPSVRNRVRFYELISLSHALISTDMDSETVREREKKLYKEEKWKELFEYLQNVVSSNSDPDIAWRFVRCGFRYGQQLLTDGDTKEAERIADTAMEGGEKALKENDRNFGLQKVRQQTQISIYSS